MKHYSALVLAIACVSLASAESNPPLGIKIRFGNFYPTSDEAQTRAGKTWTGLGFDFTGGRFSGTPGSWGLSVDLLEKGDLRTIPLTLNYIGRDRQVYYRMGAGVSLSKYFNADNENVDNVRFAYQFAIGYEFSAGRYPLSAELKWIGNVEPTLSGWGIFLGIRL